MRYPTYLIGLAAVLAAPANAQTPDPHKLGDQIAGKAKATPSANLQSKLFTATGSPPPPAQTSAPARTRSAA